MKTRTQTLNQAFKEGHSPTKYGKMINNLKKYMQCIIQADAEYIACNIMFAHAINFSKTSIGSYDNTPIHEVVEMLLNKMNCTYTIKGTPKYDEYSDTTFKEELIIIDYHYNNNVTTFTFVRKRNIYTNNVFNSKLLNIKTH